MNEEEIILRLEDIIEIHKYLCCDIEKSNNIYKDIQELINMYNKEKEKTPESIRKQFEIYQNRICELEEAIKELKEKNKELEEINKKVKELRIDRRR